MKHRLMMIPLPGTGSEVDLAGEENRHARVLRLRQGEQIELFDGAGQAAVAEVVSAGDPMRVRVLESAPAREATRNVVLCLSLIQPEKFELAIQKATELGVAAIQPLHTDQCEIRPERVQGKLERWRRIAAEAAKQCGRARIPDVREPIDVAAAIACGPGMAVLFDATGERLPDIDGAVTAFIGPEGGWSDRELERFRTAGAVVASLGARRLRAETAAIVASALLTAPWLEQ